MEEPEIERVLVIRPIHNAQKQAYEYKAVEVPAHTAKDQLIRRDEQRNHHWKGVRYATEDEINSFYKITPKAAKATQAESKVTVIDSVNTESTTVTEKGKTGRKPKAE